MRLTFLRSTCDNWRNCPNINITDQGTYVVQGYLAADLNLGSDVLAPDEAVVEIPTTLLPELSSNGTPSDAIRRTDRGTILVRGRAVTDIEVLRELSLPAGEGAVEIPISELPQLEIARDE